MGRVEAAITRRAARGGEPKRGEQHEEAGKPGRRDQEAEPATEVRTEQEVRRPAEESDRAQHREDTDDGRVPDAAGRAFGEKRVKKSHRHPFSASGTVVVVAGVLGFGDVSHGGVTPLYVVTSRQYRSYATIDFTWSSVNCAPRYGAAVVGPCLKPGILPEPRPSNRTA